MRKLHMQYMFKRKVMKVAHLFASVFSALEYIVASCNPADVQDCLQAAHVPAPTIEYDAPAPSPPTVR